MRGKREMRQRIARNALRTATRPRRRGPTRRTPSEIHTMRLAVASMLCLGFALTSTTPARAADYPEPSPYPISWELGFQHDTPKRLVVTVPGKGNRAYWYMTYSIVNKTDEDRTFLPVFEM